MASVPLPRRSARNAAVTDCLPDDVLAIVFGCLGAADLARAATVCKRFRAVLNSESHLWEAALFELDPLGRLGPQRVASALTRGVITPLALARSLGDPRCGCCHRRGGIKYCLPRLQRLCKTCDADDAGLKNVDAPVLVNRFFFVPPSHPRAVHVSTVDELRDALDEFAQAVHKPSDDDDSTHTIVLDRSIDVDGLDVSAAVKLCGRGGGSRAPKLRCYTFSVLSCDAPCMVLDGISIEAGCDMDELEERLYDSDNSAIPSFPAVETARGLESFFAFTDVVLHNCVVVSHLGPALMLGGGGSSAALHGCTLQTGSTDALLNAEVLERSHFGPPCTVSLRGCALRGSLDTHLVLGTVTDADVAALRAGNTFTHDYRVEDDVGRADAAPVVVQPWRAGALGAALRAAAQQAVAAAAAAAAASAPPQA